MRIVIVGTPGEGKTNIAKLLTDHLKRLGFNVENQDTDLVTDISHRAFVEHHPVEKITIITTTERP